MPVLTKERSKERTSSHDLVIKSPHFSRPTLWLTPPVGDRQGPRVHDTKILFLGRSISYTPGQPQPTQAISLGLPPCLDIEATIWTCRGNTLSMSVTQFHTHLDAPISLQVSVHKAKEMIWLYISLRQATSKMHCDVPHAIREAPLTVYMLARRCFEPLMAEPAHGQQWKVPTKML